MNRFFARREALKLDAEDLIGIGSPMSDRVPN